MERRLVRFCLTVMMDLLVILAVCLTAGLVIRFFGALSSTPAGSAYLSAVDHVRLPIGIAGIKTPYGGVFDADAMVTVVACLFVEWVLAGIRRSA